MDVARTFVVASSGQGFIITVGLCYGVDTKFVEYVLNLVVFTTVGLSLFARRL